MPDDFYRRRNEKIDKAHASAYCRYMRKILEQLVELLNTPSPSGDTKAIVELTKTYFDELSIESLYTNKGALIGTIPGKQTHKHRLISAHVDTLGAMVKEIKSNGRLKMTQVGGYPWNMIEGEYCTVSTNSGTTYTGTILLDKTSCHLFPQESRERKRDESTMEVRIDQPVSSDKDVQNLGIMVGDFIYFDPRCQVTESGYIKSRHLDDKAGVAALFEALRQMQAKGLQPEYTTHFLISNYEEVGHGGNSGIPKETFEYLAIDMGAPGEGQTSSEHGVSICAKDASGPYDLELKKRLIQLAEKEQIEYRVDIYPQYGSDASAMIRAGYDIKHGLIGPGIDSSHSMERTHLDGILATAKLLVAYMVSE